MPRITRTLSAPDQRLSISIYYSYHHEGPLLFRLRYELFTMSPFLHQTVKTGCVLRCCKNLLSFSLDGARLSLRHNSSIHHRSFFCYLIYFLTAFSDELFEERHLLHFLLGMVCFLRARPPPMCPLDDPCAILPRSKSKIRTLRSLANALRFSPQSINDSFCCRHGLPLDQPLFGRDTKSR